MLTRRQQMILGLIADGETTAGVARRLEIGVSTVRADLKVAARQLGVEGRAGVVAAALKSGLIEAPRAPTRSTRIAPHLQRTLVHLSLGRSASQIARHTGLSPQTVKTYLREIYSCFGTSSKEQTVATAIALGLL